MFVYNYQSINNNNHYTHSTLIAKNKKQAFLYLLEQGETPIIIKLKSMFILDKVNLDFRIHFFHQLSILSSSGISLLQCFHLLQTNCQLPLWKNIIREIIRNLENGEILTKNLSEHPKIFDSTIISLILLAENTGKYEESFLIIKGMLEHKKETALIIKKALRYPITLLIFSSLVLVIMLIFVIPQFAEIYTSFQHQLPSTTLILISISHFISTKIELLSIIFFTVGLLAAHFRMKLSECIVAIISRIPYINCIIRLNNLNLYFLTVSSTLSSGLPLSECLKCSIKTITNKRYNNDCQFIYQSIIKGESLSESMKKTSLFPSLAIQLISIAEESGKLEHFTLYLFNYYMEQYISITEQRLKSIEPILLILISSFICLIMLAMYLPIFNLGNAISGV
ncbi:type II secretion system F family protein [Providencia rustigianii]|uniref:type II secretion system F family protein n=1 Tax=Providencia rustigianii TaxID=158850 RepID=UPI000D9001DE|nr:type II secretion system F family protein [Providencia rustigianii]SPY78330.1 Cholera toxin secretion protein epsF [Providencia rustigianii]